MDDWKEATAGNIARIQQIFSINETLTPEDQIALYGQAHAAVVAQGKLANARDYWNTFVNTLRMLVAGMTSDVDPKETFD